MNIISVAPTGSLFEDMWALLLNAVLKLSIYFVLCHSEIPGPPVLELDRSHLLDLGADGRIIH
jgi:hypothetical protein